MQENNSVLISTSSFSAAVKDVDVLCIPSRFVEDHLSAIKSFVEENLGSHVVILQEGISFTSYEEIIPGSKSYLLMGPLEEVFKQIAWEYVFLKGKLFVPEGAVWEHQNLFESSFIGVHLVASGMEDFGARVYANVISNMENRASCISMEALKGSLKGIPAIICGAGPTLTGCISELKGLYSSAAIFAGGSAINALTESSVPFHAGAGIDPHPDYIRFRESSAFEVPFFYQNRFSSEILSKIDGQKISLPSSEGYVFEKWLAEECGEAEAYFDAGWTVATLLTSLATHLGCSPIIFVGMDFGYTDKMYAQELREEVNALASFDPTEGVKTKNDWIMACHWIEDWIKEHPETSVINTSTISHFKGARSIPLKEISLTEKYDTASVLHSAIQEAKVKGAPNKARAPLAEFSSSLIQCQIIVDGMLKLYEDYYPNDPTSKGEFILLEYDLYEEIGYKLLIEPVWSVWKYVFARMDTPCEHRKQLHQILFFKKILTAHL